MTLVVYLDFNMRAVFLLIALTFGAMADLTCIKIDDTVTVCTDDMTGEETTIWTY